MRSIVSKINANSGDCSLPKCLQSWRAIHSQYIYYIPRGYDDNESTLLYLLGIEKLFKAKFSRKFSILSIGGMAIDTLQFIEPVHGGVKPCSVALGPMLIESSCFASIPASKAAWLEPWFLSEELAISALGARVLRRTPCYVAPASEYAIARDGYDFAGWKSMWRQIAREERS